MVGEVVALTAPEEEGEYGSYTRLVAQFRRWTEWVSDIWAERDSVLRPVVESRGVQDSPTSPSTMMVREEIVQRQAETRPAAGQDGQSEYRFTQIEGLSDGFKASARSLSNTLNGLAMRLDELRTPPIPTSFEPGSPRMGRKLASSVVKTASPVVPRTPPDPYAEPRPQKPCLAEDKNTPAHVLQQTTALVRGMVEELQLFKEIEYEILVGEEAFVREQIRIASRDANEGS